jgi:regulatory protein
MAGIITSLQIQKNNKERVNIYLDDQYRLAVTAVVAAGLRKGQFLSDAEIEQLKRQDERQRAYSQAIFYLGFRARSRIEIERYLRDKKYSAQVIAETVERLAEEKYLDDEAFAQGWVEERGYFKPKSSKALRYELKQKGVDEAAIEEALNDLDEDDLAWRAIEGKLRQWQRLAEPDFKRKAFGFLSRRGFEYDTAREVVERAWREVETSNASEG